MRILDNRVKRTLRAGGKTCGAWMQLCSPISAEIMAHAGFDWLLVDLEHSPCSFETLTHQFQAMAATDVIPVARAPWNDVVPIKRILDAGAYGVLIPWVNSQHEAVAAVRACKYPPEGVRGVAGVRAAGYGRHAKEYQQRANAEVMVMIQIETRAAVENVKEILAVSGIDVAFIGPADLSAACGHLGDPAHPEVKAAIARIEEAAQAARVPLGTVAQGWEQAEALYERAYQLVSLSGDTAILARTSSDLVKRFRERYPLPV